MICIMGDTHGDISRFSHKSIKKLKKGDYLIICGDFGFIWDGSDREKAMLKKIGSRPYTTLFVDGCHENYSLLAQYDTAEFCGGKARCISGNLYQLLRGEIYELDGKRFFAFGGGHTGDMDLRDESSTWWAEELPSDDELARGLENLKKTDMKTDYIVTHEPPASIRDFLNCQTGQICQLNTYFDELREKVGFKMWFFGKLHLNKLVPPRYAAVFDEPYIIE
ncbi:MAG: metallophosphoesterase [Huintestinicola sp.]